MKKPVIILILLALAAAAAYYFFFASPKKAEAADTLLVSGNIEAHESLVSFKIQGRVAELPVQEGQSVAAGALLARLDDSDTAQQLAIEEAALRVRQAELGLALAGTREQEIQAAHQSLLEAEADLEQKKLDFQRAQELFQKDALSRENRDRAETALKRSQAAYERASQRYQEAREGTRREEISILRAAVEQARERVNLARVQHSYATLTAPKDGVVLVRQTELGEVVSPGTPIVSLADLDNIWLRAYVSETDLGRVRWGQEVEVRTDTYPGKVYRGRISFIADQAEFTPKTVQTHKERVTLVYRIKIEVENPNHELKPGMPADAIIQLGSRKAS